MSEKISSADLKSALTDLLSEKSISPAQQLTDSLAESRRVFQTARDVKKDIENLLSNISALEEVAFLRQQVSAFQYATTYRLKDEIKEELQRRYESALKAIALNINTFDLILHSEDMVEALVTEEKKLRKHKKQRDKLTLDESEKSLAALYAFKAKIEKRVTATIELFQDLVKQQTEEYVESQGVEVE
jgi:hypothetical protein